MPNPPRTNPGKVQMNMTTMIIDTVNFLGLLFDMFIQYSIPHYGLHQTKCNLYLLILNFLPKGQQLRQETIQVWLK